VKVLALHHGTLRDQNDFPKVVKVVFGPGLIYFRRNDFPVTSINCIGGVLDVLETVEEIEKQLYAEPEIVIDEQQLNATKENLDGI
jgi:hypothetical protein